MKFRYDEVIEQFFVNSRIERYFSNLNEINIVHIFNHENYHARNTMIYNQNEGGNHITSQLSNNKKKT